MMKLEKYPLVSVIVPVYNVKRYLERCLWSILKQSYTNIEIILVNDGSSDGSELICDEFRKKDKRIILINQENSGLSAARNSGLDIHHGSYIVFVDSDDFIHPDMIKEMLELSVSKRADIVECGIKTIKEDKGKSELAKWETPSWSSKEIRYKVLQGEQILTSCLDYKTKIMVWNKVYRSQLFEKIRFPEGVINEDEFVTPFVADLCKTYVITSRPYYAYVERKESIMHTDFNEQNLAVIKALDERLEFFSAKYDGRYDSLIQYHYFIECVELRLQMGDSFRFSAIEKNYHKLFWCALLSKRTRLIRKEKIIAYRLAPKIVQQVKRIFRRG